MSVPVNGVPSPAVIVGPRRRGVCSGQNDGKAERDGDAADRRAAGQAPQYRGFHDFSPLKPILPVARTGDHYILRLSP